MYIDSKVHPNLRNMKTARKGQDLKEGLVCLRIEKE